MKKKQVMGSTKYGYTFSHATSGEKIKLPEIEAWENRYKRDYDIRIIHPEFTSVCPKTGLPDFGVITIEYTPGDLCVELKSLKYYLLAYRHMGAFMENIVNRILDDIAGAIKPKKLTVTGEFTPRGGMRSVIIAKYPY